MAEELGIVGLGRIGGGLAAQALAKGFRVVGLERAGASPALIESGLIAAADASGFRSHLAAPRAVFLYIPAGPAIDDVIAQLQRHLDPGDVIVEIAQETVSTADEFAAKVERLKKEGRRTALLLIASADGERRFVALSLQ